MNKFSKFSLVLAILAIASAGGAYWYIQNRVAPQNPQAAKKPIRGTETSKPKPADKTPDELDLPATVSLKVPFTSQAPTANWDELHGEACEEASAIMADAYFSGMTETKLSAEYVEGQITRLTEWEKENYGYYLDIDSHETAKMMEDVYGLHTRVIANYTEQDIKKELASGNLVVLSFNGKLLGNPNFRNGGPVYHMLVVRGYNKDGFVTNDPGTRNGMNYFYTWETIYNAAGEWQHDIRKTDDDIKLAIIVSK